MNDCKILEVPQYTIAQTEEEDNGDWDEWFPIWEREMNVIISNIAVFSRLDGEKYFQLQRQNIERVREIAGFLDQDDNNELMEERNLKIEMLENIIKAQEQLK